MNAMINIYNMQLKTMKRLQSTYCADLLYAIRGFQFGQSEESEVGCIWQEVGGMPLPN